VDRRVLRLVILGVLIVALLLVAHLTGFTASFSQARVRSLIQSTGSWGILLFIAAFAIGELLHIPGLVFVGAAVLAFGRVRGAMLSYAGAIVSISVTFTFIRAVGGQPLGMIRNRRVQAMLARLDQRPILTVALIRLITWLAPATNYVLALSSVRFRDYFIGSAIGLALPVSVLAALMGIFFH
jgi:uncharacterized membrane protein YdjX (TVP38/TMEM64 family)